MSLIFENTFSSDFANIQGLQTLGGQTAGSAAPAGIPNRLYIENGYMVAFVDQGDVPTFTGIRSEIKLANDTLGDDMWYGFDVLLQAADWVQLGTEEMSIFQIHTLDSISGTSINMSAVIIHGALHFVIPSPAPPTTPIVSTPTAAGIPVPFGTRFRVVMHALWKADTTGVLEVFIDRVPVLRQYNRATGYTADQPYLKVGVYDTFHSASFGTRLARYRNLKIYRGISSYGEVLGGRPLLPRALVA